MKDLLKRTPIYTHLIAPALLWRERQQVQNSDDIYHGDSDFWSGVDAAGGIATESQELNAVHYGYTSALIAKAFIEHNHKPRNVLDIGSGEGYWLKWYPATYSSDIQGVEIGERQVGKLRDEGHTVHWSDVLKWVESADQQFDTINAIGVMHHILPDENREKVIEHFKRLLSPGGLLVVGGLFERKRKQFTVPGGQVYKRSWPLSHWLGTMDGYDHKLYRNPSCEWRGVIPQNNILVFHKP